MQTDWYFKAYPHSQLVFTTADGFLFHNRYDAANHAKTLANKTVTEVARPGQAKPKAVVGNDATIGTGAQPVATGQVEPGPAGTDESSEPMANEPADTKQIEPAAAKAPVAAKPAAKRASRKTTYPTHQ
ncbi:MAG: hypothetical protein EAY75_14990 [Bacteroidetes bacterium]|nr:MAG: hypothetical protein EAY75_14990 [Bacteroidota bacterium]